MERDQDNGELFSLHFRLDASGLRDAASLRMASALKDTPLPQRAGGSAARPYVAPNAAYYGQGIPESVYGGCERP